MARALLPVVALLLGAGILLIGNGLQAILLPVRATIEHFSTGAIGLIGAAYPLGFIFSCRYTPYVVKRVGHIRAFAVFSAIAASTVLMLVLWVHPAVWIGLRIVTGFCFAGIFMVIESWLNEACDNANRGQVFSAYMVVNLSTVTAGQMILPLGDPAGFTLFALAAIAITLGLVPVSLTAGSGPPPIAQVRLRLARLYAISPVGVAGCFFVGVGNGAFGSFGAVFAGDAGLSVTGIALFMSAALVGGALAQIPFGRLSDRMDRRRVIALVCLLGVGCGVLLMLAGDARSGGRMLPVELGTQSVSDGALIALIFLFGASIYPLYGLCVAHTNDFVEPADFVEASSGLLLTWGVGAAIGPVLASLLMAATGLSGLFVFTALVHAAFGAFTLYRMARRAAPPPEARSDFVAATPAERTTPVAVALDPRAPDAGPEVVAGAARRAA